jgi:hypothetical protein
MGSGIHNPPVLQHSITPFENAPKRADGAAPSETRLPFAVGEKLAAVGDHDTISLWVRLLLNIDLEIDGAHDAVAEHLVNDRG